MSALAPIPSVVLNGPQILRGSFMSDNLNVFEIIKAKTGHRHEPNKHEN
jgi:hypothetical protein